MASPFYLDEDRQEKLVQLWQEYLGPLSPENRLTLFRLGQEYELGPLPSIQRNSVLAGWSRIESSARRLMEALDDPIFKSNPYSERRRPLSPDIADSETRALASQFDFMKQPLNRLIQSAQGHIDGLSRSDAWAKGGPNPDALTRLIRGLQGLWENQTREVVPISEWGAFVAFVEGVIRTLGDEPPAAETLGRRIKDVVSKTRKTLT